MLTKEKQDGFEPYVATDDGTRETIISSDAVFKGTIKFKGILRIDGKFQGDIISQGTLYIGKTGDVKASIKAESVIIEGKVNGNIIADNRVELRSSAKLFGDIKASRLAIEEGVSFVGNCDVNPANEKIDISIEADSAGQDKVKSAEKKRLLDSLKEKDASGDKDAAKGK
ncbi:MAG: polymer-forming cytoskeletal protein [Candidatus Aureabacteria bacterium]|nr:polymer-forming cytoskeletal protein [Candidatus Auribacterota bacterium]